MYRLIIVDDEDVIRKGLVSVVDWEALGFTVFDTFANGSEAYAYIKKNPVDAVLADIRMPRLSGLDLARLLRKESSAVQVVILSGYENFRYAQEAIDLNIFSYLLKPVKEDQLKDVFSRLKARLDQLHDGKRAKEQSPDESRDLNISDWLKGNRQEPPGGFMVGSCSLSSGPAAVLIIQAHSNNYGPEEEMVVPYLSIRRQVQQKYQDSDIRSIISENVLIFLLCGNCITGARDILDVALLELHSIPDIMLSAALGRTLGSLSDVPESYKTASKAIEHRMYLGLNRLIRFSDVEHVSQNEEDFADEALLDSTANSIRSGDNYTVRKSLSELFDRIKKACVFDPQIVHSVLHVFFYGIKRRLSGTINDIHNILPRDSELLHELDAFATLDQKKDWIQGCLDDAVDAALRIPSSPRHAGISVAIRHIEESFSEDLSLEAVADLINMSPAYFSRLFKQVSGENFKEYLTKIRIREAKKLLSESSLKIYEIAEKVGYRDQHYFSEIFRKKTGIPPLEYRNTSIKNIL